MFCGLGVSSFIFCGSGSSQQGCRRSCGQQSVCLWRFEQTREANKPFLLRVIKANCRDQVACVDVAEPFTLRVGFLASIWVGFNIQPLGTQNSAGRQWSPSLWRTGLIGCTAKIKSSG